LSEDAAPGPIRLALGIEDPDRSSNPTGSRLGEKRAAIGRRVSHTNFPWNFERLKTEHSKWAHPNDPFNDWFETLKR
jgi:hypothetical protein